MDVLTPPPPPEEPPEDSPDSQDSPEEPNVSPGATEGALAAPGTPPAPRSRFRWWLGFLLRFGGAAAGILYIAYTVNWRSYTDAQGIPRPGFVTLLQHADVAKLLLATLLAGCVFPLITTRWRWLLHGVGIHTTWARTFRLTMLGQFVNYCVPVGTTGGDVARAYGATAGLAGAGPKVAAVVSILADRAVGLGSLILLSGLLGLTRLDDPVVRQVALFAWTAVALGAATLGLYLWGPSRRALGIERLGRLPGIGRVLDAMEHYRRQHFIPVFKAVALSLVVHALLAAAATLAGLALGLQAPILRIMATLPIVFATGSLPISYQGLGVMEATAIALIGGGEPAENAIVGMLLIHRAYLLLFAINGAWGLIGGTVRLHPPDNPTPHTPAESCDSAGPSESPNPSD